MSVSSVRSSRNPVLLIAIAAMAVSSTGCHLGFMRAKSTRTASFTVAEPATGFCRVQTRNGTVRCVAGDVSEIQVEAQITARGANQEDALRRAEMISVDVIDNDGVTEIAANIPKGTYGSVSMTLTVPQALSMDVRTSNGRIDVTGLGGSLKGTTSNGTVSVVDCGGPIELKTSNGKLNIQGETIQMLTARTSNGSVDVKGALLPGRHKIRTSNGSIHVGAYGFPMAVTGVTSNGSVRINGDKVKKGETIFLGLPGGVMQTSGSEVVELDLHTSNGSIKVQHALDMPVEIESVETEGIEIEGLVPTDLEEFEIDLTDPNGGPVEETDVPITSPI